MLRRSLSITIRHFFILLNTTDNWDQQQQKKVPGKVFLGDHIASRIETVKIIHNYRKLQPAQLFGAIALGDRDIFSSK